MSGYRNLHRQQVSEEEVPIWQVQSTLLPKPSNATTATTQTQPWCVWTASADGCVRSYRVQEKDVKDDLNAAALTLTCTHALLGSSQVYPPPSQTLLGCTQVSIGRNYVGDDDMAGDMVVTSLDLTGRVRVWTCAAQELSCAQENPKHLVASYEFNVEGATGTAMAFCPPSISGNGDVVVALACLDGSIAMVATGLATPKATKEPSSAGTVLDNWGGGSIAMSLTWHPTMHSLAVGRKDGAVDIIPFTKKGTHRLLQHGTPVRAIAFTPDGQLLVTGSDDGLICVWDVNRKIPTLVHHVVQAHSSWILNVATMADNRRFVTCGADQKIHIWNVGQIYAPMHTFQCDHTVWTVHITPQRQPHRLISGNEKGWVQIFSLEA